jgi:carbonyl reductase 1
LAEEFVEAIHVGRHREAGWPESMYGVSKLLLSMYTRVEAELLSSRSIMVNACCPGWVRVGPLGPPWIRI